MGRIIKINSCFLKPANDSEKVSFRSTMGALLSELNIYIYIMYSAMINPDSKTNKIVFLIIIITADAGPSQLRESKVK